MATVAAAMAVRGEIHASEDLVVEGQVEGPIWCDGCAVTIGPAATLHSDIFARDITVLGRVTGTLVASEVVDIRSEGSVIGRVVSARLILNEGATFQGSSEPQHLEAALRVARHRRVGPEGEPDPPDAPAGRARDRRTRAVQEPPPAGPLPGAVRPPR
jgi:cytoskeletal protein CcmA (bactofilin family)